MIHLNEKTLLTEPLKSGPEWRVLLLENVISLAPIKSSIERAEVLQAKET